MEEAPRLPLAPAQVLRPPQLRLRCNLFGECRQLLLERCNSLLEGFIDWRLFGNGFFRFSCLRCCRSMRQGLQVASPLERVPGD